MHSFSAASAERREADFDIFDFELTADPMQQIRQLNRGERIIDPSFAPSWER
jgi:diketogulonate reductase-like aldo/keto reductase